MSLIDQALHRTKQRRIELVRERQIEQSRLVGSVGRMVDIKPTTECRNFFGDVVGPKADRLPVKAVTRDSNDVALLVENRKHDSRLVGREQRLDFVRFDRQGIRQRRIVGKFGCKPLLQARAFGGNCGKPGLTSSPAPHLRA